MSKSTWQASLGALLIAFAALGCTVAVVGGCDGEDGDIWDFLLDSSDDDNGSAQDGDTADNGATEDETAEDGDDAEDDSGEDGKVPRVCRIEIQVLERGTNAPLPGVNVSFSGYKEYKSGGQIVDIPHSHMGPYNQVTNADGFQWFEFNYNLGGTNNEYACIDALVDSVERDSFSVVGEAFSHTDATTNLGYADPAIVKHHVLYLGPIRDD